MRLIDADALIKALKNKRKATEGTWKDTFRVLIAETPTIDAVPIVRCEECEHSMNKHIGGYKKCALLDAWMQDGSFCSNGERKEG